MSIKNTVEIIIRDIEELKIVAERFIGYDKVPQIEVDILSKKVKELQETISIFDNYNKDMSEQHIKKLEYAKQKTIKIKEEQENVFLAEPYDEPNISLSEDSLADEEGKSQLGDKNTIKPGSTEEDYKRTIVGEKLQKEGLFVNEKIGKGQNPMGVSDKIRQVPISDIGKAIPLNDKFLYIRELFNGDPDAYKETIQALNNLSSIEEAMSLIKNTFNWDFENENAIRFLEIVQRKYS